MNRDYKELAVILPTLNEEGNIKWLLRRFEILQTLLLSHNVDSIPKSLHLVFVDDGSRDGTVEKIKEYTNSNKSSYSLSKVTLLTRTRKHGLGNAYKDAVRVLTSAKAEPPSLIAIMDADGSHDPIDLFRMLTLFCNNSDKKPLCVIGSRYTCGGAVDRWGTSRRILSIGANATTQVLLSLSGFPGTRRYFKSVRDTSDSFRIYDTDILRETLKEVESTGFSVQEECLFHMMIKYPSRPVLECPIFFRMRRKGESKCSLKEVFQFATAILGIFLLH